ncbi:MAG: DUF4038 domain-containing protein [Candidatus Omnitrophica bacterium]|nr:DUF4038 domain-containing protein [Candidatus Omnitrophota bacterium]
MKISAIFGISAFLFIFHLSASRAEVTTGVWHPLDFEFTSDKEYKNPFDDPFIARVAGPRGESLTVPGFYNGEVTWKVRVMGTSPGRWTLETEAGDPNLNGNTAEFLCTENSDPDVHGSLRVDSDHPHHFVYEDGTRYFLLGYECDWIWALDLTRKDTPTLNSFLDKLAGFGFNHIILNGYAHDTSWRKGKTGEDDYGPPPMFAWEGTNEDPDHSRMNLDYWNHYDQVIQGMFERGIEAHLMIKVYNKKVKWPKRLSKEEDLYFRWLIARYSAYPNIVWDFSKESYNEKDFDYKLNRLRFIRETDPYNHLITVHDDNDSYEKGRYDELLDFSSDQQHKDWHEKIQEQRERRDWPIVNVEFGYEHGPEGMEDKTYGVVQSPEENVRRAWEICMAGGYPCYYYTHTAWDVIRSEDTPKGYRLFSELKDFFEGMEYWKLEPSNSLIEEGYCLANPGEEYLFYFPKSGKTEIDLSNAKAPMHGTWHRPYSGEESDAGSLDAKKQSATPPGEWEGEPVALHLMKVE